MTSPLDFQPAAAPARLLALDALAYLLDDPEHRDEETTKALAQKDASRQQLSRFPPTRTDIPLVLRDPSNPLASNLEIPELEMLSPRGFLDELLKRPIVRTLRTELLRTAFGHPVEVSGDLVAAGGSARAFQLILEDRRSQSDTWAADRPALLAMVASWLRVEPFDWREAPRLAHSARPVDIQLEELIGDVECPLNEAISGAELVRVLAWSINEMAGQPREEDQRRPGPLQEVVFESIRHLSGIELLMRLADSSARAPSRRVHFRSDRYWEEVWENGFSGRDWDADMRREWLRRLRREIDERRLRVEWRPRRSKRAVCASGGGLRSATFALGGLQALTETGELADADYLIAISGGGYIASAFATVTSLSAGVDVPLGKQAPGEAALPAFHPESPEHSYLRNNTTYLLPTAIAKLWAVWRLILGLTLNLLALGAAVVVVGIPIGGFLMWRLAYPHLGDPGLEIANLPRPGVDWMLLVLMAAGLVLGWVLISGLKTKLTARYLKLASGYALALLGIAALLLVVLPWLISVVRFPAAQRGGILDAVANIVDWIDAAKEPLAALGITVAGIGAGAAAGSTAGSKLLPSIAIFAAWFVVPGLVFGFLVYVSAWTTADTMGAVEWSIAAIILLFLVRIDVKTSSLHPFYKERLASAFAIRRTSDITAGVVPPEEAPMSAYASPERPEFISCAAANVTDVGINPPGRKALPFTFSGREVWWPEGSIPMLDWELALSPRRSEDISMSTAVAVSGAAVSPGMGKSTRPSLTALIALSNLRLGVWLPNPLWLAANPFGFVKQARIHYLVREALGIFRKNNPFLYVSDGGHWENLGLVEALRRGCTEIYVFDASGDQLHEATTLGQAIALAREETGVDLRGAAIENVLSPAASGSIARSSRAVLKIPFKYPNGVGGVIMYCKNTITDDSPADAKEFQRANPDFPTTTTLRQLFTGEQFEAYRVLGHDTGLAAVRSMRLARAARR